MINQNIRPMIRFSEFSLDWVNSELGSIANFNPKVKLPEIFKYVDLESVKGSSLISYRVERKDSAPSRAQRLAKIGDVFYQTVRPYQKNNYLFDKVDKDYVFSSGYAQLRPICDGSFLLTLLQRDSFVQSVLDNCTGTSYPAINSPVLARLKVNHPCQVEEHIKLGVYFQCVENQLKLHQIKLTKLQQLKKAMLIKMFPKAGQKVPELRFAGFCGEWVKRSFCDCFTFLSNITLSRAELNYEYGLAKNIHYGDILVKFGEVLDISTEKVPFVSDSDLVTKMMSKALKNGDVLFADAAEDTSVGKCTEINNLGDEILLAGLHTIAIRPSIEFASKYLGYFLNSSSYHNQLIPLMQGTKVLSISKSSIKDTLVFYPQDKLEQTKIGEYFQNLDRLINLQQQQIDKLQNLKQAYLTKMFV